MGQLQRVAGDKVEALIEGHRRVSRKALGEPGRLGHVAPDGQVARLEELRCRNLPIAGALLPQLSAEPRRQRGSERLGALGGSTGRPNRVGLIGSRHRERHFRDPFQKEGRQVVQAPLPHWLLAQLRQHPGNVVGEHPARREDGHRLRGQPLFLTIQQVGNPVQRDGSLARAGHALNDKRAGRLIANDGVLLALDGGDDIMHLRVRRAPENRREYLVAHAGAGVHRVAQLPLLDGDLPLERERSLPAPGRCLEGGRPRLEVVEQRGHRASPIGDERLVLPGEGEAPEVGDLACGRRLAFGRTGR